MVQPLLNPNWLEDHLARLEAEKSPYDDMVPDNLDAELFTPDVMNHIEGIIREMMYEKTYFSEDEFRIKEICLYGSVANGTATEDSDIDILVEYEGTAREDDVFNTLHEEGPTFFGRSLDFNPIKAEKSGTIEEYLKRCKK